jgi:phosphoglycolate phosphatase
LKTIQKLKTNFPNTKLVVLSDAPHRSVLWRLHRLGLANYFDGIYGLEDSKVPIINGKIGVTEHQLLKHIDMWVYGFIGKHRPLPNDYRKPNPKGLKSILIDFDLPQEDIVFIGDNVFRDIELANSIGATSIFAQYGTVVDPTCVDILREFIPERFIHKGLNIQDDNHPKAKYTITDYSQILDIIT